MGAFGRGVYIDLLAWCFEDGTIPDDPAEIARMVGESVAEVEAVWPLLRSCFDSDPDGSLYNARLRRAVKEWQSYQKQQSKHGVKGNVVRWGKRPAKRQVHTESEDSSDRPPDRNPIAKPSPASATASKILESKHVDLDSRVVHIPAEPAEERGVENGKVEEPEPRPRPSSFDVLGISNMFDRLQGKVEVEEVQQHTEVVRFLNALFPAKRVGQGLSAVVRTWTGRIEEHRIKRAIKEIQDGEYPGDNGTRIGWRDLDKDRRKRVVLSVMNGMLN